MAARLIKTADGALEVRFSYMMEHEARTAIRNEMFARKMGGEKRTFFWRSTNNPKEHEICAAIKSRNHRDGFCEVGLSVSQHTSYQVALGYRYIYPVSGDQIGTGSDGEPVLANAIPLAKPRRKPQAKFVKMDDSLDSRPASEEEVERAKYVYDFSEATRDGEVVLLRAI